MPFAMSVPCNFQSLAHKAKLALDGMVAALAATGICMKQ